MLFSRAKKSNWKNTVNVPNVFHGNEPNVYVTGKMPTNFDSIKKSR